VGTRDDNKLCSCGSGKKYKKCHKLMSTTTPMVGLPKSPGGEGTRLTHGWHDGATASVASGLGLDLPDDVFDFGPVDDSARKSQEELRPILFKAIKSEVEVCLPPDGQCDNPPIRAHSIQNATVLQVLSEDGHVVMPRARIDLRQGPRVQFERVGRNVATTFPGLCSSHDTQVFLPIDTRPLDLEDKEQLLLLAYRALVRELNAMMSAGARVVRFNYAKNPTDLKSHLLPLFPSYALHQHKAIYDAAMIGRSFSDIDHVVALHRHVPCQIAVNSFCSDGDIDFERQKRVAVNVFPSNGDTAIVLSFPREQGLPDVPLLKELVGTSGPEQLFLLSRFVLQNCENITLRPSYWAKMTPEQREIIHRFYVDNSLDDKVDSQNRLLNLFE
jgi:SEC-C motif-containing protein